MNALLQSYITVWTAWFDLFFKFGGLLLPNGGYKQLNNSPKANLLPGQLICFNRLKTPGNQLFGQYKHHFRQRTLWVNYPTLQLKNRQNSDLLYTGEALPWSQFIQSLKSKIKVSLGDNPIELIALIISQTCSHEMVVKS